jgi:hypothetical protein
VTRQIHIGSDLDPATLEGLADFICGDDAERFPVYRSSSYLTKFFQDVGVDVAHDGSTRKWWVLEQLRHLQPAAQERVALRLVDPRVYGGKREDLALAVHSMKQILGLDGYSIAFDKNRPFITDSLADEVDYNNLPPSKQESPDETGFLSQQFPDQVTIDDLKLDPVITPILQARVEEAQSCPRDKVPLGSIFLLGSTLEGILLGVALKDQRPFMTAPSAPKDRSGSPKKIQDWKLVELIDVSCQLGLLSLDVKKFSHELRDFRNYIHPYHQMSQGFSPDQHTVDICWQVFKAAFFQLKAKVT